ncbi:MAG TPA: prepilin-type N-terminal cleavage/methylation domain-containing protein [Solirubrobacter sp.]|nr:prepilin-type N-terminal cleavage/methylation domain-containing protein [Solirubrobacter sp.]
MEHEPKVLAVMRARARREDGMTLPELLVTLTIALVVTLAVFSLVEVTMRKSGEASARVDAVQRGRSAMDLVTRQLRSQVCLQNTSVVGMVKPRSIESATANEVVFYADTRDTSVNAPTPPPGSPTGPERRRIALVDGTIVEERWALNAVGDKYSHAPAATAARNLLTNVELDQSDGAPAPTPLFRYFAYDQTLTVPQPTKELVPNPALTADQLQSVARIQITYRAHPTQRRADGRASTVFENDVTARTVDPNADPSELANPCL